MRKAGSVVGMELESPSTIAERGTLSRLYWTDRLRRSFVPRAIQLYNSTQKELSIMDWSA